MLTHREIATVVAALQYWREEIAAHEPELAQNYLPHDSDWKPLNVAEVAHLERRFLNRVRYVCCDSVVERLLSTKCSARPNLSWSGPVAIVILPD